MDGGVAEAGEGRTGGDVARVAPLAGVRGEEGGGRGGDPHRRRRRGCRGGTLLQNAVWFLTSSLHHQ